MVNKRKNIDQLFRDNLSDYELPNHTGSWDTLHELILHQDRKKKKRRWIFLIFFVSIMLGSLWMFFMPKNKLELSNAQSTIENKASHALKAPGESKKNSLSESTLSESSSNHLLHSPDSAAGIISVDSISQQNTRIKDFNKQVKKIQPKTKTLQKTDEKFSQIHRIVEGTGILKDSSNDHFSSHSKPTDLTDTITGSSLSKTPDVSAKSTSLLSNEINQQNDSIQNPILMAKQADISVHITVNDADQELDTPLRNPAIIDSLSSTKDSVSIGINIPEQILPGRTAFKHFNISVGANLFQTSQNFEEEIKVAPNIGFGYSQPIKLRWIVSIGIVYAPQSGYVLMDTAQQETYFFDHIVSQQAIQIHRLHKLYFPVTVNYSFSKKISMLTGLQMSYLLNTSGDYSEVKYTSSSYDENNKTNVKGYMDGITPFNVGIALGYNYRFSDKLYWSTRFARDMFGSYTKDYFYGVDSGPQWSVFTQIHFNF